MGGLKTTSSQDGFKVFKVTASLAPSCRPVILSRAFVTGAIKATNKRRDAFKRIRLAIGTSRVRLTDWDGNVIDGALVDGAFPDYARVVPRVASRNMGR